MKTTLSDKINIHGPILVDDYILVEDVKTFIQKAKAIVHCSGLGCEECSVKIDKINELLGDQLNGN
jgi:hypothetical protein